MKSILYKITFLIVMIVASIQVSSAAMPDEILSDPAQEARAKTLSHEIRCLVCQGEAIDESQSRFARDIRVLVRNQIVMGKTDTEILSFLQSKYGDYILMSPPKNKKTWALYAAPFLVLIFGCLFMFFGVFRKEETS